MKTDVFVKVVSPCVDTADMAADVETAFSMFRAFESRFSRFRPESELSLFNACREMTVSDELFSLLERSLRWFRETEGLFDPSVLPFLEAEGYAGSFRTSRFGTPSIAGNPTSARLDEMTLDRKTRSVRKPVELRIDLGGIGKGYVVDRVAEFLRGRYEHFFICAGGDIFASGKNSEAGYDFWAIDVENPNGGQLSAPTLLLSGKAVATSGTERRSWITKGRKKHHLIDPRTGRSAETDLVSASVVGNSVEEAEVWAKVLCILGSEYGTILAKKRRIPSIFIRKDGTMIKNGAIEEFLWKS